jgi:hypothetical protein
MSNEGNTQQRWERHGDARDWEDQHKGWDEEADEGPPNLLARNEAEHFFWKRFNQIAFLDIFVLYNFSISRRQERERLAAYGVRHIWGHSPTHHELERVFEEYEFTIKS